jgi:transposase
VIRVSQWAEIRQMHLVEGVSKREIARRLGLDVKTVRRAVAAERAPAERLSPARGRALDPFRERIRHWLLDEPELTSKRIRTLLLPEGVRIGERAARRYVAEVRGELFPREAFVHRTARPGDAMEGDFGEAWAVVAGAAHKVRVFVATLPASNVYFAKAYRFERIECLLDGLGSAFRHFGGVPARVVLDNTSLAVKRILGGREREETAAFHAFRGSYPFEAEFCGPGKAWEKGSVEGGVGYVRDNAFRPTPRAGSMEELNARLLLDLERDLDARRLPDGRTVRQAWQAEREHLRPLPVHEPDPARALSRVVDKFGHVQVDRVRYSVPIGLAYRAVWVRAYPDRVEIAFEGEVVARHARETRPGAHVIEPRHVLALLERKHRGALESTAIQGWNLPGAFHELRRALVRLTRHGEREWVQVLRLMEERAERDVEAAVAEAIARGSPRLETIRQLLRQHSATSPAALPCVGHLRADLARLDVAAPDLGAYDHLVEDLR